MPRAHDDCNFRDEWLVQDKYKEWVVKDGDPRLARCQFCMKSSKFHHPWYPDTFSIFLANLDNIYIIGKLENSGVWQTLNYLHILKIEFSVIF